MQTRLSKIFLYANATLKPISEDAGTFLWSRSYLKYSYWFLSSHHLEKKGTISDISEIYSGNRSCHFPIFLVVCPKREGSWWQGRVYGEDGALNPASNNHYQLGTGSLISSRALRVLDTRLVLEIFCPTRTRLGPNTTRTE